MHIKILGVSLLRVNIIAIATVNSEINLKTGSFPKNVFLHTCNMIIQIFHQSINFLTLRILAPRQKLNFLQKPFPLGWIIRFWFANTTAFVSQMS